MYYYKSFILKAFYLIQWLYVLINMYYIFRFPDKGNPILCLTHIN